MDGRKCELCVQHAEESIIYYMVRMGFGRGGRSESGVGGQRRRRVLELDGDKRLVGASNTPKQRIHPSTLTGDSSWESAGGSKRIRQAGVASSAVPVPVTETILRREGGKSACVLGA